MAAVLFIAIQATYQDVGIALFKNNLCIARTCAQHARASSSLIPLLRDFLMQHNVALKDLAFIAADAGPGAFTSLRVIIATINGLAYGQTLPLVSVSSFEGLVAQVGSQRVLALLNAYNNDVYFAYAESGRVVLSGCSKYEALPAALETVKTAEVITVVGNGLAVYPTLFSLVQTAFCAAEQGALMLPSAESIGVVAYQKWLRGEVVSKLEPLYLKDLVYRIPKQMPE